ncbi:hypothetical protein CrV_gp023 [Cylindrospermopsis raciborskii virus RM-2018a]|jgi:hypothetical protein|nr:hypothetical protein CrV_gp023 [Cylindrospermopsis raciborskii virus RM-2018a]WHL30589.1 hypothetical protein CrLKS4_g23 [Cylindrospermopsis phage Cr-LKS4]
MNIESLTASALQHLPTNYFSTNNLELKFNIGSGAFSVDPETGNYIQSTTVTTLICSAIEDNKTKAIESPGNLGVSVIYLKGRLSNPKLMPAAITLDRVGTAKLTNLDGTILEGVWKFIAVTQNRINAYTQARGTFFRGTITVPTAV